MAMGRQGTGTPRRETANGARLKPGEFRKTTKGPTKARIPTDLEPPGMQLTWGEQMFVLHMLECSNQTEAARRAGYGEGKAAIDVGAKMMANPRIRAALSAHAGKSAMGVMELLAREAEIARSDYSCVVSFDHRDEPYIDLKKIRRLNKWHWIRKLKWGKEGIEVELHDSSQARERLMRVHGLFHDKRTITHRIDLTNIPDTPQHWALVQAMARGEIDEGEFLRSMQALGYDPAPSASAGQSPSTIDADAVSVEVDGAEDP